MDESLENPMRRFKAFWLAAGMILLVAFAGVVYRAINAPDGELDDGAAAVRLASLVEWRETEEKAVTDMGLTFHGPEGGHLTRVTVPDDIIETSLAALKANPAHKTEQLIPGSKTFMEQQSATHDPTESAFLSE